jgi:hypothetical protein
VALPGQRLQSRHRATSNNNARLTWGTQYGFLGQFTYDVNDGIAANAPGFPEKSYSTYVVLGTHSSGPVEAQVAQVETMQSLVLSATIGNVVTSGPAGIARPDSVTYVPAGYNHVYGALAFEASGDELDANVNVGAGTLVKPLFIISNYTGGEPDVTLDGVALVADSDYFASVRADASELWLTLNRELAGDTNHLQLVAGSVAFPTDFTATATSTTQVALAWTAVAGAASYEIHRSSGNAPYALLTTTAGTAYNDLSVAANTTYLYKVRVVAPTPSPFSSIDPATTVLFTDPLLAAGSTKVKLLHITQLRTAVNAMRGAGGLPAQGFTDPALTVATRIKRLHLTELRTALDAGRAAIGVPALAYADVAITAAVTRVKAAHVTELRDGVK